MSEKWEMHDNGIANLACGIVKTAVNDYACARRWLSKMECDEWEIFIRSRYKHRLAKTAKENVEQAINDIHEREICETRRSMKEIEMFFHSDLYRMLCNIDGQKILDHINAELDKKIPKELARILDRWHKKGVTKV